eukprot:1946836-Amphidinium_carterae.1
MYLATTSLVDLSGPSVHSSNLKVRSTSKQVLCPCRPDCRANRRIWAVFQSKPLCQGRAWRSGQILLESPLLQVDLETAKFAFSAFPFLCDARIASPVSNKRPHPRHPACALDAYLHE